MKTILFVRHGESVDDLTNQFGGWADFDLTPNGRSQLAKTADEVKKLNLDFETIFYSPLKRAWESAYILGTKLGIDTEELLYLKEYNGYGLLSGVDKATAETKYSDLLELLYDPNGYVPGSEPVEEFQKRAEKVLEIIQASNFNNVIAVSHGGMLKEIFNQFASTKIKFGDGGFILTEFEGEKLELKESYNGEVE